MGAENVVAAEKEGTKIAVEIKSFLSDSDIADLEQALGQYVLYGNILHKSEPERALYLAVTDGTYRDTFCDPIGELVMEESHVSLIVFDASNEVIVQWIPERPIEEL